MIRTQIICDGCGKIGLESQGKGRMNAGNMRVELTRHGWVNNTNRACVGSNDWCRECWASFRQNLAAALSPQPDPIT
jgi:hypothetical protein